MVAIYRTVLKALIQDKLTYVRKIGGRVRQGFCRDLGEVPVKRHNKETGVFEDVVNPRGNAYAHRRDVKYRKKDNE